MRVLLIGPIEAGGSIPPYLTVFADAMRHLGVHVDRLGTPGVPYDRETHRFWPVDRLLSEAHRLLNTVDLNAYDILSIHFGNLEVEQLLPVLWRKQRRPPAVYHVHSLAWTLFTDHHPNPALFTAVQDGVAAMDGYIHFGTYARSAAVDVLNPTALDAVAWLPTTIPPGTSPRLSPHLTTAVTAAGQPVATLYGYAAPWKDAPTLQKALRRATRPVRAVLAGPFWDDPAQAFTDLTAEAQQPVTYGVTEFSVAATYMDAHQRRGLVDATDLALFPYRSCPTFQGSGAIGDYLAHGTPVLATDVANMAELVGPAGAVVPPDDPAAFAHGLDELAHDTTRRRRAVRAAQQRAARFTPHHHAAEALRLYEKVIQHARVGAR